MTTIEAVSESIHEEGVTVKVATATWADEEELDDGLVTLNPRWLYHLVTPLAAS